MAVSQVKGVLEKEITCALCLDIFKEPKKLTCDHVYCKVCLGMLARRNASATISCPECRTTTQLPQGTIENLPTAFHMNRLIDAFKQVQAQEEKDKAQKEKDGKAQAHTTSTSASAVTKSSVSGLCNEDWVSVGRDDMFAAGPGSTSEWQRMCAVREREQLSQHPQPSSERATTFSQFFSQLKTEWKVLVQGVKGGILRRSKSRDQETRYTHIKRCVVTVGHS